MSERTRIAMKIMQTLLGFCGGPSSEARSLKESLVEELNDRSTEIAETAVKLTDALLNELDRTK